MRSVYRILCLFVMVHLTQSACSASSVKGADNGELISPVGVEVNGLDNNQGVFYAYDSHSSRLNLVDANNQTLSFSPMLNVGGSQQSSFILGHTDNYYFIVDGRELYLQGQQGGKELINKFAANIVSVAKNIELGTFVFIDEFFSLMVLQMNQSSQLEASYLGGSLVNGELQIKSGDILSSGLFLLITNDSQLLSIDIEQTLISQTWVFQQFPLDVGRVNWVGKLEGADHQALLLNEAKVLFLVDGESGQIIKQQDFTGFEILSSKRGQDHLIVYDPGTRSSSVIKGSDGSSWLSFALPEVNFPTRLSQVDENYLLVSAGDFNQTFYKLRLTDGLIERRLDIATSGKIGISKSAVTIFEDSPLGFIKLVDFESEEETIFSGFNLESLQSP